MITHKIIKHRVKITAPTVQPTNVSHFPVPHNKASVLGQVPTPESYQKYLDNFHIKKGDYITTNYRAAGAENLLHVHLVYAVEPECPVRGIVRWRQQHPEVFWLLQLDMTASPSRPPWNRRDSCHDYRILTQDEFLKLVEPNRDKLRDFIDTYSSHKTNP